MVIVKTNVYCRKKSKGFFKMCSYLCSFECNNNVSLLVGDLEFVAFSHVPGFVSISALNTHIGQEGRQHAAEGQGDVTASQVTGLVDSLLGVAGAGVDASLSER